MEKKKEEKERIRKEYGKERTQKMCSFRLDNELEDFLNSKPNKGRFINDAIRKAMKDEPWDY